MQKLNLNIGPSRELIFTPLTQQPFNPINLSTHQPFTQSTNQPILQSPVPNSYFQFKQFIINQDRCTMKVATDSCILGALFAGKLGNAGSALDIGAGTGLQMLMLAQKNTLKIDGIELDPNAWRQAKENLEKSRWKNQFEIYDGDVRTFSFAKKYDFIISNPPFYENDLTSPSAKKNQTRHSSDLNFQELISAIARNLEPEGSFGLLLPYHRIDHLFECCHAFQYWPSEQLNIRQTPYHDYFRSIVRFSKTKPAEPASSELIIMEESGQYAEAFVRLLKDYYLWL
jgi:tRNA1Val (adenine37-N6)-methyltransferase